MAENWNEIVAVVVVLKKQEVLEMSCHHFLSCILVPEELVHCHLDLKVNSMTELDKILEVF